MIKKYHQNRKIFRCEKCRVKIEKDFTDSIIDWCEMINEFMKKHDVGCYDKES